MPPGLDIVPRRFDHIVETGTNGAYFDWAVGEGTIAALDRETPVVRPELRSGDAVIFDKLLLHRTAADPAMAHARSAIETWSFAATDRPGGHVPLVW